MDSRWKQKFRNLPSFKQNPQDSMTWNTLHKNENAERVGVATVLSCKPTRITVQDFTGRFPPHITTVLGTVSQYVFILRTNERETSFSVFVTMFLVHLASSAQTTEKGFVLFLSFVIINHWGTCRSAKSPSQ